MSKTKAKRQDTVEHLTNFIVAIEKFGDEKVLADCTCDGQDFCIVGLKKELNRLNRLARPLIGERGVTVENVLLFQQAALANGCDLSSATRWACLSTLQLYARLMSAPKARKCR